MEAVDYIALTILALVIFMIIYRFYFKKQHRNIRSVQTNPVSATSPQNIPTDETPRHHACLATYSMDIKIEDYDNKEKHIFSAIDKAKVAKTTTASNVSKIAIGDYGKSRLTLTLGAKLNDLNIYSEYLKSTGKKEIIERIPLGGWVNITVVFETNRMEVYINGRLSGTYILQNPVISGDLNMYTTQNNGFSGYIKNVQYIPDTLSTKEINSIMGNSSGKVESIYDTLNKALNTVLELPGKYFYNYDNGSCV